MITPICDFPVITFYLSYYSKIKVKNDNHWSEYD